MLKLSKKELHRIIDRVMKLQDKYYEEKYHPFMETEMRYIEEHWGDLDDDETSWHYIKDGDYPKEGSHILMYSDSGYYEAIYYPEPPATDNMVRWMYIPEEIEKEDKRKNKKGMSKLSKILLIVGASLLIAGGIVLAVYEATKKEDVVVKTLNEYIVEDYHSVADTLSEGTSFFFYEVETVLNTQIHKAPVDSINVVEYTCVLQTEKNVHFIHRNLVENTREVETVYNDTWAGCFQIHSPEFPVSFEQALVSVKDCEYKTPHTKYMTLRWPLGVRYDNPIYIFGNSRNGGLCVDSFTGEVKIFE